MSVANTYAKALYETAREKATSVNESTVLLDLLEKEMASVVLAVQSSKPFQAALYAPITNSKEKLNLIRELAKRLGTSNLLSDFLALLANKRRLVLLPEIEKAFRAVRLAGEGGLSGKLVSAEPLAQGDVDGLAQAFGRKFGKRVDFQASTDASLLAGMKVTVNGVTYDGTLRSQLQRLRDRFVLGNSGV